MSAAYIGSVLDRTKRKDGKLSRFFSAKPFVRVSVVFPPKFEKQTFEGYETILEGISLFKVALQYFYEGKKHLQFYNSCVVVAFIW